ncbi:MAG: hypothetical protein AAGU11_13910, partial [Syntrophobacteraceae bacterium]
LARKLSMEGRIGAMVFAASKGRQSALESPDLGGGFGVFAYTVTLAIGSNSAEADANGNGYVEFMELVDYVSRTVDTETQGAQMPWLSRKELFGDLAVAVVTGMPKSSALKAADVQAKAAEPPPKPGNPADSLNPIRQTITTFYSLVQNRNIDQAISLYSAAKRLKIKRKILEDISKSTQFYRIDKIEPVRISYDRASVTVFLYHKKFNVPEEYWEAKIDLVKEQEGWRIVNTPGHRIR